MRRKIATGAGSPPRGRRGGQSDGARGAADLPPPYIEACRLAEEGRYEEAREAYAGLLRLRRRAKKDAWLRGLIHNDLTVLDAIEGKLEEARRRWRRASEENGDLLLARLNRDLLEAEMAMADAEEDLEELKLVPWPGAGLGGAQRISSPPPQRPSLIKGEGDYSAVGALGAGSARVSDPAVGTTAGLHVPSRSSSHDPTRIAIFSFLFNWPSTGGGNMHTAGLVEFLVRAGYQVRHYFARYPAWGIGRIPQNGLIASEALEFDDASWSVGAIQARCRRAVEDFQPDYVAITDAWNMKPHLADAMRGYPVFLLFQAQECLCPLNNLRLLGVGPNEFEQCTRNQLASPQVCHGCLAQRGQHSGALHQVERALAGVASAEYDRKLRQSLVEAEAVLALNPLTAAMLEPYARRVCVVPWGIDAGRFPCPVEDVETGAPAVEADGQFGRPTPNKLVRLFMAAVAGETIKGFHVAHEACRLLRQTRRDFELVVTFDPPGQIDEFTHSVGWQSQAELPRHYREADVCLVPTIAQDGLSITSVEAMASALPVVASRIGGVPYTVTDGVTGLLCEPGDPADLANKIARLLDDPNLRYEMGLAGRRRFEADFTWETVIERCWRPLLAPRVESRR
jgi:glycosyltransferase involved in cell wall biosynthesis